MYPFIVADIGGTNARFALVTGKSGNHYQIDNIQVLKAAEYPSCADALQHYLDLLGSVKPKAACLAVAGPVTSDHVRMTNLNWEFSCKQMAKQFGFNHFLAMNDFAAVAAACSQMTDDHLLVIKPGEQNPGATKAVFGPGTGLGVAGLVIHDGRWVPVPCEGGHVNIAPSTPFETEIIKAAMATYGHVSAETFISGPGLVNLYKTICTVRGVTAQSVEPATITHNAVEGTSEIHLETLNTFCSFIGAFAGNLALTYGAKGGVYMAGGVLPRFSDFLIKSPFIERFQNKGIMSHYVRDIPTSLMTHPETAFVGAAAWLEQHVG